jgi:hypothetical protein
MNEEYEQIDERDEKIRALNAVRESQMAMIESQAAMINDLVEVCARLTKAIRLLGPDDSV